MELLDHMAVLFLIFWGIFILFSIVTTPVYIPINSAWGYLFPTSFPTLIICCLIDNSQSDECEVISHCGFGLHFPDGWWRQTSFHVPVGRVYVFLEKCLFRSSAYLSVRFSFLDVECYKVFVYFGSWPFVGYTICKSSPIQ